MRSGTVPSGTFQRIKGDNYIIADIKGTVIQMGPGLRRFVPSLGDSDEAITFFGDARMAITGLVFNDANTSITTGTLYIKKGAAIESTVDLAGLTANNTEITQLVQRESDVFDGYQIFLTQGKNPTGSSSTGGGRGVFITIINSDQIVLFGDNSRDIFGYAQVQVDDREFMDGCAAKDCNPRASGKGRIVFLSDRITLLEDDPTPLPGLIYLAKWPYFSNQKLVNIGATDAVTRDSGESFKFTDGQVSQFLRSDVNEIWGYVLGAGQTRAPALAVVDEKSANKGMALVLMGGPVANTLTADLVTLGKSKVDWFTSAGDIEVIPNAYTSGKSVIIVAGKNREATKAAADALAAALA